MWLTLDVKSKPHVIAAGAAGAEGPAGGGSVAVGAYAGGKAVAGLSLADCVAFSSNTTNGKVRFTTGANFGHLVGRNVTLKLEITTAIVYTIGWAE